MSDDVTHLQKFSDPVILCGYYFSYICKNVVEKGPILDGLFEEKSSISIEDAIQDSENKMAAQKSFHIQPGVSSNRFKLLEQSKKE